MQRWALLRVLWVIQGGGGVGARDGYALEDHMVKNRCAADAGLKPHIGNINLAGNTNRI